jgi:hypothetical protein
LSSSHLLPVSFHPFMPYQSAPVETFLSLLACILQQRRSRHTATAAPGEQGAPEEEQVTHTHTHTHTHKHTHRHAHTYTHTHRHTHTHERLDRRTTLICTERRVTGYACLSVLSGRDSVGSYLASFFWPVRYYSCPFFHSIQAAWNSSSDGEGSCNDSIQMLFVSGQEAQASENPGYDGRFGVRQPVCSAHCEDTR